MSTGRRGYVIAGQKKLRRRDKIAFGLGIVLLAAFPMGSAYIGFLGLILVLVACLDFRFNTKPPTKFFPARGERKRFLDRD